MKIGYARVSTTGQDLGSQKELLEEKGCRKIFVEKLTGTSTAQRTQLTAMIDQVREGDTIIVTKIDRLARSIIDLNKLVNKINDKDASVQFIKENMTFAAGEENNSMHQLMFNILGSFAQFERDLIVERTTEGRERAKEQGKHMGRPSRPKKDIERAMTLYEDRENNRMSVSDIVKLTGVPRSTIYNQAKGMKK